MNTLLRLTLPLALTALLFACGGSDSNDDAIPRGDALSDIQLVDSDSYLPLSKLRSNRQLFQESDKDYGTKNPGYKAGEKTQSIWAIDASAKGPKGKSVEYSMQIDSITADGSAYNSMLTNLKIDTNTGFIYQECAGFPTCYDNSTGRDQDFQITVLARFAGSAEVLERSLVLRVIAN